jgi:hypothetical protein
MKALIVLVFIFSFASHTMGQCSKDTDCKGNRICVKGECVELDQTEQKMAPVVQPQKINSGASQTSATAQLNIDKQSGGNAGWSKGAGVSGLVLSTIASSFGVAAVANEGTTAEALGGISLAVLGADVPITAAGGGSARQQFSDGLPALRILSWVTYASTIGCGIGMISTGIANGDVPVGLRIATVISEAISGFGMAADAMVCGAQARQTAQKSEPNVRLSFTPLVRGAKAGVQLNF